ncbi:MAG: hypothetical protein K0S96_1508, partial [Geminicoccaceae bacterium]|nr:hypothetical protein [Geminicoccaceae bacterium]
RSIGLGSPLMAPLACLPARPVAAYM